MPQAMPLQDKISQDSARSTRFRVLASELGNGYRKYAQDGLNAKRDSWNIVYHNLTLTEKNLVTQTLDSLGGHDYLIWQPFGEQFTKNFIVSEYSYTALSGELYNISLSMQQEFV